MPPKKPPIESMAPANTNREESVAPVIIYGLEEERREQIESNSSRSDWPTKRPASGVSTLDEHEQKLIGEGKNLTGDDLESSKQHIRKFAILVTKHLPAIEEHCALDNNEKPFYEEVRKAAHIARDFYLKFEKTQPAGDKLPQRLHAESEQVRQTTQELFDRLNLRDSYLLASEALRPLFSYMQTEEWKQDPYYRGDKNHAVYAIQEFEDLWHGSARNDHRDEPSTDTADDWRGPRESERREQTPFYQRYVNHLKQERGKGR